MSGEAIAACGLWVKAVNDCNLQAVVCGLWAAGTGLRAAGCELRAVGCGQGAVSYGLLARAVGTGRWDTWKVRRAP